MKRPAASSEKAAREAAGALSPAPQKEQTTSGAAPDAASAAASCTPSPSSLLPLQSSPSGEGQEVQDEYENFSLRVEALLHPLKTLFGRVAAYEFLARAFAVIGRYKEKRVPLPNCCTYSCVSFAMAISGIPDEDEKRRQWFASVSTGSRSKQLRENICMWTMTYP